MSQPYRRQAPKVGPNEKCPCGSGKKLKHCHGRAEFALPNLLHQDKLDKVFKERVKQFRREHEAKEHQRKKQQGLGRPIVSTEFNGKRVVAVGSRLFHGGWKTFPDFLGDYIKMTLGSDWGNAELTKPLAERHLIFQWYDRICAIQQQYKKGPGEVFSAPITGASSAYNRLAYNLYLIAHNGTDIQQRLLHRLRDRDNFQGAFFETQVAAWMIRAGFELEYEDEEDGSTSHCEFTATFKDTGEKFSVEAKSRALGIDGKPPRRLTVGNQLGKALKKKADHSRIVFIDLNRPLHSVEHADKVVSDSHKKLRQAASLMIEGRPAPPAYVCLANVPDQYALDDNQISTMVALHGYKIPDFVDVGFSSIRDAVRSRKKHWPLWQLLKSIEEYRDIPATFDGGLPSEVFNEGQSAKLRVGGVYLVPGPESKEVPAELESATVMDGKAYCSVHDPIAGKRWIVTIPMTAEELSDYEKFPDTYFGVYQKQGRKNLETPLEIYDFMFETYQHSSKEKLLEFMANSPDSDYLKSLSQEVLAEIYCERMAYSIFARGEKDPH